MDFSSKLLENAIGEIAKLPGIGRRTALRLALHLLRSPEDYSLSLTKAILALRQKMLYCKHCHNLSDRTVCEICSNPKRDDRLICVVEDIRDVVAIENTGQYLGLYHVLGGIISPMDGVGPQDLNLTSLVEKAKSGVVDEIIFALSATMEADTTNFYIYRLIEPFSVKTSTIARGVSIGDELEYTDEVTLGRSILARIPFEHSVSKS